MPSRPTAVPRSASRVIATTARARETWQVRLAGVGLVFAAVAAYANSLGGPFIFDDLLSIPQNPTLANWLTALAPPGGALTVSGRPFLNLTFAVNRFLGGDVVGGYHAVNLLIHVVAGLTLFGLVRRTLAGLSRARAGMPAPVTRPAADATWIAFAVALLWLVHPLQTESVTYVVQRAESLMGLLYLLTLYGFVRGVEAGSQRWFALAVGCCLLGMFTKEVMVSAPLLVFLYDRTFVAGSYRAAWRQRRGVHLLLAATWLPLAVLVGGGAGRAGTAGLGVGVSFAAYAATQFEALCRYLALSVWPCPLIIDYGVQWVAWREVWPQVLGVTALVAATGWALVRRPAVGFLGLWFFAILAPTSLIPGMRQTLAEHRMYLALVPVVVLGVLAVQAVLGRRARWVLLAVAAVGGGLTARRNLDYQSDARIWADAVAKRPGNAAAQNNYGNILAREGRFEAALACYDAALRIEPGFADAQHNAGNALLSLGRPAEAMVRYEQALRALAGRAEVRTKLGDALRALGRNDEARAQYEEALRQDPNYAAAHNNLGNLLREADRQPEAIAHYEAAIRLKPEVPEVYNNLGIALLIAGRPHDAIARFEQALRLNPDLAQVHLNLGLALASIGRGAEAAPHLQTARRLGATLPDLGR
ncbi:tetratricopeptide repeat protein [Opitutus sp. ER46]|uniref:tetratricopeptide repeat protein n=1 Tax=Opitutus sp. ER46 TaxID=2161864 RepID=UPI000D32577A|nr:tetratricopeptide repeat protein [Opitutus sp. ER46]PTX96536.1 hypothetical protein DB354_07720 [Opitutus sp. ER46]